MPKCEACGATFATKEELMQHNETHVTKVESFKCQACGATFGSQQLLEARKGSPPHGDIPLATYGGAG